MSDRGDQLRREVRQRVLADIPATVDLLHRVHIHDHYPAQWPRDAAAWISPSRQRCAWVYVLDGRVVGHVAVHSAEHHPVADLWMSASGLMVHQLEVVSRLFVDPLVRGRGLAAELMRVAVSHAYDSGLRPVLDVGAYNSGAQRLYERLGWEVVGLLPVSEQRRIAVIAMIGPVAPQT